MKIKKMAMAVALALCATGVLAEDFNETPTLVVNPDNPLQYSGTIGVTHIESGDFTDTFTFTPSLIGDVSASLITIGFEPSQNIDFTSVFLNGNALSLSPTGVLEFAYTGTPLFLNGPIQLVVNGMAGPLDGAVSASYAGTLNVSAIPEPETYLMMLGGLGVVGFLARRRKVKEPETGGLVPA